MKASELIERLKLQIKLHGDIAVTRQNDYRELCEITECEFQNKETFFRDTNSKEPQESQTLASINLSSNRVPRTG